MEKTTKSASGTSFHNHTIITTPNQLIKAFGKPSMGDNDGYDKVNLEWVLEDKEGNVVTIYDWKEYEPLEYDQQYEFHIGGKSSYITSQAQETILCLIEA